MTWIIGMVLLIVGFVALRVIGGRLRDSRDEDVQKVGRVLRVLGWVVIVGMPILTLASSINQIPAGNVGVIYEFGAIKRQIEEGFQMVFPWQSVLVANIQVQRHMFDKLDSFSQETQTVYVRASLNISVSPNAIQELYRAVGPNYFNVLIEPRVYQNFKDEIVKYKSVDIAPNREKIRQEVRRRLEKELSTHSITVEDLLLDNIDFRDEFEHAIEAKQIATQKALEEEQKVVVERHRAEQVLEKAKGEGNAILAVAEKQAEANKKLSESLSPELIQYTFIQKLSEKIQLMLLPVGQNFIFDPGTLIKEKEEKK